MYERVVHGREDALGEEHEVRLRVEYLGRGRFCTHAGASPGTLPLSPAGQPAHTRFPSHDH